MKRHVILKVYFWIGVNVIGIPDVLIHDLRESLIVKTKRHFVGSNMSKFKKQK